MQEALTIGPKYLYEAGSSGTDGGHFPTRSASTRQYCRNADRRTETSRQEAPPGTSKVDQYATCDRPHKDREPQGAAHQ